MKEISTLARQLTSIHPNSAESPGNH
uniref:Uncharacterized protein n=1 Tax=Arundo donax TaxID=35708 RepID=A0A0A9GQX1_ARUDO